MATCYMCQKKATTKEHAPPKCLFPEKKDLSEGIDFRKTLVTVPSCDEHNSKKSADDEYLLYCLSSNIVSNEIGKKHFSSKVVRAIIRNPSLRNKLLDRHIEVNIQDTKTNKYFKTTGIKMDDERFDRSIEQLSRALYFHHYNKKWLGDISIQPNFMLTLEDKNRNEKIKEMDEKSELVFSNIESCGDNPKIFKYKIIEKENKKVMRLYFYEGNRITIFFK